MVLGDLLTKKTINKKQPIAVNIIKVKVKVKPSTCVAPCMVKTTLKRSGMDHTVLPATNTMPALPRKRSPDGAFTDWGGEHLIAAHYSFIDPERMKGWVGLVGWSSADGFTHIVVTRPLKVERRTGSVRRPKTGVPPTVLRTGKVEDRPIMPVNHCLPLLVFYFWRKL